MRKARSWSDDQSIPCVVTEEDDRNSGIVSTPYGDLRFLNLEGSFEQMYADFGRRLREETHLGAVPFFSRYLEKVLLNSPLKSLARTINWSTIATVSERLKENVPKYFDDAIQAFAENAEVDLDTVYRAYLVPESFLWLLATYHRILGTRRSPGLGAPPLFGCTSAVSIPPRSKHTLHARNFDYFGIDYWDRFAAVTFHKPDQGLNYVAVGTAGFLGSGITSMNSAGLTFCVHQHFPAKFDLTGVPVGVAGEQVIRFSETIDDAVEILRDFPPVGGWTYIMSEGRTGRAAVYEVAPGVESLTWIRPEHAALGYANVYWADELKQTEIDFFPEYRRCNYARQDRVADCITSRDATTPFDMARILGDSTDPVTRTERILGPTILTPLTVASVVFEPSEQRIWVGAGTSPTSRGWYIPFRLDENGGGPEVDHLPPFQPYPEWHERPEGRAFALYREAMVGSLEQMPEERQLVLIEHAIALAPEDPSLRVIAGLLALKLGKGRRAEGAFRRALERITRRDRHAEVRLYLGWAVDCQGMRGNAKSIYRNVQSDHDADSVIRKRARHQRLIKFDARAAKRLAIDLTYGGIP